MHPTTPTRLATPFLGILALALALAGCSDPEPQRELAFAGPEDGALINAEELESLGVEVTATWDEPELAAGEPDVADLRLLLDGDDRTDEAELADGRLIWSPTGLADGERTIAVASDPTAGNPGDDAGSDGGESEDAEPEVLHSWTVTVNATPPELEVTEPNSAVVAGEEVTIAGTTDPGATVAVEGQEVEADDDGAFSITLDRAPDGEFEVVATDRAGNRSDDVVELVTVPSRVEVDELRTVHVSFCGWASPSLKEPVLDLIDRGLINAVQLDLKDESGTIGYHTDNELAVTAGAADAPCNFDLGEAVAELHALDVPVIGRIVAFADPALAQWAWDNDARDMVMQTDDGEKYIGRYAGFSNFANEDVVEYNLDIAEEAAAAGVDHILWDYIRKPDGVDARFPGLEGDPGDAIVDFTARAHERVQRYGAKHGASVYGVSADRPTEVAQPVTLMAEYLDYVAPMIYPSHWGPGEYDVADPLMQPYDIVAASLEKFQEATEGTPARVIPWLEDSNYPISLGYPDRANYLEAQIEATYDAGITEWLLWDSAVRYTDSAMIQPPD